jgi:GTP-binding protein EngB required for normal cell division
MKKPLLTICLVVLSLIITYAGNGDANNNHTTVCTPFTDRPGQVYHKQDLFIHKTPVTFFGVDYSHVRVAGNNMMDIKDEFTTVNKLLLTNKSKYNMTQALWRSQQINYDFSAVTTKNDKIKDSLLFSQRLSTFTDFDIQKYVDELDINPSSTSEGIGVVIMAQFLYNMGEDALGTPETESIYYYVFFDISSKKLLFSEKIPLINERYTNQNIWAYAIKRTMHNVRDFRFQYWKNAYGK